MNNPRLASRYAKSIMGLSIEQNELEAVFSDMKLIISVCQYSSEFVSVLKSPVFSSDKKEKIIKAVLESKVSRLTNLFIGLLMRKTRENALQEIAASFVEQYYQLKGIHKATLTTAIPISEELKQSIAEKLKANTSIKNLEMDVKINDRIIGGFQLQIGDHLIDASISRDLSDVKKQFLNNDYIHRIR